MIRQDETKIKCMKSKNKKNVVKMSNSDIIFKTEYVYSIMTKIS